MKKIINILLVVIAIVGVSIIVITFVTAFSTSEKSLWGKWEIKTTDNAATEYQSIEVDKENGSMTVQLANSETLKCDYTVSKKNVIIIDGTEYKFSVSGDTLTLTPADSEGVSIEYAKVEVKEEETKN